MTRSITLPLLPQPRQFQICFLVLTATGVLSRHAFRGFARSKPRSTAAMEALRFNPWRLPISAFKSEAALSDEFLFRRYSSAICLSRLTM